MMRVFAVFIPIFVFFFVLFINHPQWKISALKKALLIGCMGAAAFICTLIILFLFTLFNPGGIT